jgi:alpha-tubulin suppressor-like RCC1 family protein
MFASGIVRRAAPTLRRALHQSSSAKSEPAGHAVEQRWAYLALAAGAGSLTYWAFNSIKRLDAESALAIENAPIIEQPRPQARSVEEYKELISPQHAQSRRNWENPGVYAWGLNTGRVVAPDSDEKWIKTPRRLPFFDAVLLRDLKLDKEFGAAIDENGNLLQWGVGYDPNSRRPEVTLKGQNLQSMAISDSRIIALASNGQVFSVPVSREEQQNDPKLHESSWLWSASKTSVACRDLTPGNLRMGERVTNIVGGLEHVVMLTSSGRVYTAASSTKDYPSRGQLGIPGLGWYTRPSGPFDQPHEVTELKGHAITHIAAGDTHTLAMDKSGKVFAFGNNSQGQLGLNLKSESMNLTNALRINPMVVDTPSQLPIASLYPLDKVTTKVVAIAAGGENSFFVIKRQAPESSNSNLSSVSYDAWTCGRGISGTLGNGKLTHIQWGLTKIPFFSGLLEYNEQKRLQESIPVKGFQVGQNHVAAIMGNITNIASSRSQNDTNWGSDVYFFGNNEHYQLGNGKRASLSTPASIPALGALSKEVKSKDLDMERLQLAPAKSITFAGRKVKVVQQLECGRQCSAVYSSAV